MEIPDSRVMLGILFLVVLAVYFTWVAPDDSSEDEE